MHEQKYESLSYHNLKSSFDLTHEMPQGDKRELLIITIFSNCGLSQGGRVNGYKTEKGKHVRKLYINSKLGRKST